MSELLTTLVTITVGTSSRLSFGSTAITETRQESRFGRRRTDLPTVRTIGVHLETGNTFLHNDMVPYDVRGVISSGYDMYAAFGLIIH